MTHKEHEALMDALIDAYSEGEDSATKYEWGTRGRPRDEVLAEIMSDLTKVFGDLEDDVDE